MIAAVAHGALVAPALHASILLRATYLAIGATGARAYAYRELFARFVPPDIADGVLVGGHEQLDIR